jgi:hypothetical protein
VPLGPLRWLGLAPLGLLASSLGLASVGLGLASSLGLASLGLRLDPLCSPEVVRDSLFRFAVLTGSPSVSVAGNPGRRALARATT